MTPEPLHVAVSATSGRWLAYVRSYARDHASGVEVETLMDPRQLHRPGRRRFDALVIDDMARLFPAAMVGAAVDEGTFVIGLFDERNGMGRAHLEALGAQLILPASIPPEELIDTLTRVAPAQVQDRGDAPALSAHPGESRGSNRGALSVWFGATGGCGTTEAVIGAAEELAQTGSVLLVEAEPLSATLAARLQRSPESGLAWTLGQITQGHPAFPAGLTPPRDDGMAALGTFDVICQTSSSGGPPVVNAALLSALVGEAVGLYDHVLVTAGPLVTASAATAKDRFAAGRTLLGLADVVLASASADPLGAVELGAWKAAAIEIGLRAPTWAVLGRASRTRYEQAELVDLVSSSTGAHPYERLWFLPEDAAVARARWNTDLVRRGRWRGAVGALAAALGDVTPKLDSGQVERSDAWGMVMSR